MRAFTATLAFAACLGLAAAQCAQEANPKGPTPGILAISSPDPSHPVTAGASTTITWKVCTIQALLLFQILTPLQKLASSAKQVAFALCKGPSTDCEPLRCLAENVDNIGSYTFTVPSDLAASASSSGGYGLKIIEIGTGNFQYSQQFGIINSSPVSSSSGPASAVTQISDGQVQLPPATSTTPLYPISGAATGTGSVASTGLYYVAAPTGKTSNTTHASGYKYSYGPNTAPAVPINSTLLLSSTGGVFASGSGLPAVTSVAVASGGAGGVGAPGSSGSPATTSPITQATNAAPRMVAGGVLAGLGAVAILFL